jgi:microcystin-dependent protein
MEPFLGQITLLACNFAPYNWAMCQGQLLRITQYSALFSLLGTNYGGDGRTTFGLPNLQGRVANGQGQAPGLSDYVMGELGGTENVALTTQTVPAHNHAFLAYTTAANLTAPAGALPARGPVVSDGRGVDTTTTLYSTGAPNVALASGQVAPVTGGGVPHANIQPYLALNWCISLSGVFPARP